MKIGIVKTANKCKHILYLKPFDLLPLMILFLLEVALSIILPLITVRFIDSLSDLCSINEYVLIMIVYFIFRIVNSAISCISDYLFDTKEFISSQNVRLRLMNALFDKNGAFFSSSRGGDIFATLDQDISMVASYFYKMVNVLSNIISAITVAVVLILLRWELFAIILLFIPISFYLNSKVNRKVSDYSTRCRDDFGKQESLTEEFVSNPMPMIQFGLKKMFIRKYSCSQKTYNKCYKRLAFYNMISGSCMDLSMTFASIVSMVYGGLLVINNKISIGVLVAFLEYIDSFISPLLSLTALKTMAYRLQPSLERICGLFDTKDDSPKRNMIDNCNNIKFDNVTFYYSHKNYILKDSTFSFESGKIYALLGKSGEGKSTIINLLLKLWRPQKGNIYIDNVDILNFDNEGLRNAISIVSQNSFFLHDTIIENVSLGVSYSYDQISNALEKVGLLESVLNFPDGMNTIIGDNGVVLSGGQRQRLSIARALLKNTPIVIFDEPTSSLDSLTEKVVYEAIKSLHNKIVIIISHHENVKDIADVIYYLENKKILKN